MQRLLMMRTAGASRGGSAAATAVGQTEVLAFPMLAARGGGSCWVVFGRSPESSAISPRNSPAHWLCLAPGAAVGSLASCVGSSEAPTGPTAKDGPFSFVSFLRGPPAGSVETRGSSEEARVMRAEGLPLVGESAVKKA